MTKKDFIKATKALCKNTLMETLAIEFVDMTEDTIIARMPVNSSVHQPDGVLHGGASVALAESVASAGAFLFLKEDNVQIRGIEISANHVKSIKEGYVYAKAKIIHKGRTTQLWHIPIVNEKEELISLAKLTTLTLRS